MANIRPIPQPLATKAAIELNEVPDRIAADIQAIKNWLISTPHIKCRKDDQFLVAFLRGCKYSIETVKDKLDVYYSVRLAIPELMLCRDPMCPKTQLMLDLGLVVPMPKTASPDAPRVVVIRSGVHNPNIVSFSDYLALGLINTDILLTDDDHLSVAGQILIFDLKGVTMSHIAGTGPIELKRLIFLNQEAVPVRQKFIHFLNAPPSFFAVYNLGKTLVCDKIRKRMMIHDTIADLHKFVPKRILPTELGGDLGPYSEMAADWKEKVLSKRDYLLEDLNYGIDLTKLQGRSTIHEWISNGVEGTFRTLNVD